MIEVALRRFLDSPHRQLVVIIVSFGVGLATILPLVDEYSDLRDQRAEAESSLAVVRAAMSRLEKFEGRVHEKVAQLQRLEARTVSEDQVHTFRGQVVELVRASGCQIRRISAGNTNRRTWHTSDDPLDRSKVKHAEETPYELQSQSFSLSVSGNLPEIKELLSNLYAKRYLAHTSKLSLRPVGTERKEVILDLELKLFHLAAKKSVSA